MVFALLAACTWSSPTFHVDSVEPVEARPGDTVTIRGGGLVPPLVITLERQGWQHVVVPALADEEEVAFVVPEAPVGTHTLGVQQGTRRQTVGLTVLAAPPETPCARPYEANTELSLPEGVATVVRFHPDGQTERVTTAIEEIETLEVSFTPDADGPGCGAIHLRLRDGSRLLFEDGPRRLDARAATLGTYLDKPVESVGPAAPR
jgi:hypothetical protein